MWPYVPRSDKQELAEHFQAQPQSADLSRLDAGYNVTPTTYQPVIRQSRVCGTRELILACWGLVPFFTWTATADSILQELARVCSAISGTAR